MTATRELSPVGTMILLWLLVPRQEAGTTSSLVKALKPLLEHRWSGSAEQGRVIDEELAALESAEQLTQVKKRSVRFVVTDEGKRAGLAALGVTTLPKGGWKAIKKYLLASALALPASAAKSTPKSAVDAEHVGGTILKHHYQLQVGERSTPLQAVDALVWRALGVETEKRLTLKALQEWVLKRELGLEKVPDPEKAAGQLAAKLVGATRAGGAELQLAVIRRWIDGAPVVPQISDVAPPTSTALKPASSAEREPINDDASFAAGVLEAARASKTGRFGEDKVFISHVFRKLVDEGAIADDATAFKDRLISAHRDDHLTLSRADLVGAMSPADVDSSEARYLGATFHFIHV